VRDLNYLQSPPETREALQLLESALADASPHIRLEAVGVLGRIAGGKALLKRALKSEGTPFVRDAIVETLAKPR